MPPTRLSVDAQTPAGWRDKGFYSVFNDQAGPIDNNLEYSLLYKMIELGRERPLDPYSAVPEHIQLGLQRTNECPLPGEFEEYAKKKPLQGMPLAITGLEEGEYRTLQQWIKDGAVIDERPSPPGHQEQAQILQWAAFLNQPAPRNQLVSRYLYEHLFLAHLYFEQLDSGNFFELVRSRTPVGEPIQIIPTVRPNDDPGQPFFYRLRKIEGTIVHKTHIVYPLGEQKLDRLHRLFLTPQWEVGKLPDYSAGNALNPFATFAAIPARARYQFMLDTAEYFVMTFIRGPVCRGQVATDVIDDRFYVLFQDPDSDLSVTDPAYMASVAPLPALTPEKLRLFCPGPGLGGAKTREGRLHPLSGKSLPPTATRRTFTSGHLGRRRHQRQCGADRLQELRQCDGYPGLRGCRPQDPVGHGLSHAGAHLLRTGGQF